MRQHFTAYHFNVTMALNKPSKLFFKWHSESPVTDLEVLKLAIFKQFPTGDVSINGSRVVLQLTYTSSNAKIDSKLEVYSGNIRWSRAGPLSEEEETRVDDLIRQLAAAPKPTSSKRTTKKRKIASSDEDEAESEPEVKPKRKQQFKKRAQLDDFSDDGSKE